MAGIYIHFPFCRQKCHYCNFYSTPSLRQKDEIIGMLHKELLLRRHFTDELIKTIYFGGGTPSLMTIDEIKSLIDTAGEKFIVDGTPEIAIEVNPDDINAQKIREFKTSAINRISIGVQSFFKNDLAYLNRIHTQGQAEYSVKALQDAGFTNLSIDLIFGMPTLNDENWKANLVKAADMEIPHISAYAITVEPRTNLDVLIRKGKFQAVSDEDAARQFRIIMNFLREKNYIHYEISNFCRTGYESKHNKSYWENDVYLGIGPSAHSFNRATRFWNCSNINDYIASISKNRIPCESEDLSKDQQFNEYIMMSLRTHRGASLMDINRYFGEEYSSFFQKMMKKYENSDKTYISEGIFRLTDEGKIFADSIIADFFMVD